MHAIWQWVNCTAWDARTACRLQRVSAAAVGPLPTQQRFAVLPAAWVRCSSSVRGCSMLTLDCGPPSSTKNHLCVEWLVDSLSGVQACSTLNTVFFFLPSVLLQTRLPRPLPARGVNSRCWPYPLWHIPNDHVHNSRPERAAGRPLFLPQWARVLLHGHRLVWGAVCAVGCALQGKQVSSSCMLCGCGVRL